MALTNDQITAQNFKEFYGQIRPYLNGAAHSGFTPIGTIISVMGKTAPLNYLICDGTIYNIADYPELAAYFTGQFGSSNFFGGDGTTTFAVPDLRGEFLRGTGTNSRANQGSGSAVGVHQNATEFPGIGYSTEQNTNYLLLPSKGTDMNNSSQNPDSQIGSGNNSYINKQGTNQYTRTQKFTARPTNTSVLYCIAYKNIFVDEGCNYSTDERVVGTWIDSKPIYQKTITGTTPAISLSPLTIADVTNLNVIEINGNINNRFSVNTLVADSSYSNAIKNSASCYINASKTDLRLNVGENLVSSPFSVTIRYTKTTD